MTEEGIVRLRLSSEQANAFNALGAVERTREKYAHITRVIYGGQAGGGKSFLICLWLDHMAQTYPATRYYMAREHLKDIKESVLLTFWDVIAQNGSKVHYNAQSNHITYPNGSQIFLVDCFAYPADPNFDSMGSREYTAGAIEEGITVTERAADILISRTRYKHDVYGLHPKQLITCNPGEGWIKDKIVMPSLDGVPMQANEIFIRATLKSNPNKVFVKQYSKTLDENLSEFDRARLMEGDWNARPRTGSEFLKHFNQKQHIYPCAYDKDLALHLTFDENVHPYITCEIWQIKKVGDMRHVEQIDEICLPPPRNTRKIVCEEFDRRYHFHKSKVFVYGDATSQKGETPKEHGDYFFSDIITHLKSFSPTLRVPSINPPVTSSGAFLDLILEKTYRKIRIGVDPRCKHSISDYAFTLEDMDGGILKKRITDPQTGISFEKNGHNVDAARYFICEAFVNDFLAYLRGGVEGNYVTGNDHKEVFQR